MEVINRSVFMGKIDSKILDRGGLKIEIKTPEIKEAQAMINFIKQADGESEFLLREPDEFRITLQKEQDIIRNMRESEDEIFICAKVGNRIIANLGFFRSNKKRVRHHGRFGIAVLKEYWGIGVGTILIKEMIKWAKDNGIIKITLEVDEDNNRAMELYRNFGFIEEGKLIMDKKMSDGRFKSTILMGRLDTE